MGELVDRPSQPAELRPEQVEVRRPRLGRRPAARSIRPSACRPADVVALDAQRLAGHGDDVEVEHHLAVRRPFKRSTQAASQLGVVGLPDLLADLELAQVDRLATEPKLEPAR